MLNGSHPSERRFLLTEVRCPEGKLSQGMFIASGTFSPGLVLTHGGCLRLILPQKEGRATPGAEAVLRLPGLPVEVGPAVTPAGTRCLPREGKRPDLASLPALARVFAEVSVSPERSHCRLQRHGEGTEFSLERASFPPSASLHGDAVPSPSLCLQHVPRVLAMNVRGPCPTRSSWSWRERGTPRWELEGWRERR